MRSRFVKDSPSMEYSTLFPGLYSFFHFSHGPISWGIQEGSKTKILISSFRYPTPGLPLGQPAVGFPQGIEWKVMVDLSDTLLDPLG
jgi:hypothetical protein